MTGAAPSGVVTFLFTDVEGSTRRWKADADGMRAALLQHDEVLRTAIEGTAASCSSTHAIAGVLNQLFKQLIEQGVTGVSLRTLDLIKYGSLQ